MSKCILFYNYYNLLNYLILEKKKRKKKTNLYQNTNKIVITIRKKKSI